MTTFSAGTPNLIGQATLTVSNGVGPVKLTFPYRQDGLGNTLTPLVPIRPRHAYIVNEGTTALRYGLSPSDSSGILLSFYNAAIPGTGILDWTDPQNDFTGILQQVQFINLGSVPATLQCLFFD